MPSQTKNFVLGEPWWELLFWSSLWSLGIPSRIVPTHRLRPHGQESIFFNLAILSHFGYTLASQQRRLYDRDRLRDLCRTNSRLSLYVLGGPVSNRAILLSAVIGEVRAVRAAFNLTWSDECLSLTTNRIVRGSGFVGILRHHIFCRNVSDPSTQSYCGTLWSDAVADVKAAINAVLAIPCAAIALILTHATRWTWRAHDLSGIPTTGPSDPRKNWANGNWLCHCKQTARTWTHVRQLRSLGQTDGLGSPTTTANR